MGKRPVLGQTRTKQGLSISLLIRIIAEFAVPVWNSSLTGYDVIKLERIQKIAFNIILGDEYLSYTNALKLLGMQKLSERRKHLCIKFAKKSLKRNKFSN